MNIFIYDYFLYEIICLVQDGDIREDSLFIFVITMASLLLLGLLLDKDYLLIITLMKKKMIKAHHKMVLRQQKNMK